VSTNIGANLINNEKGSRKGAKIAKDAKMLYVVLSLLFQVHRENKNLSNRNFAPLRLGEMFFSRNDERAI